MNVRDHFWIHWKHREGTVRHNGCIAEEGEVAGFYLYAVWQEGRTACESTPSSVLDAFSRSSFESRGWRWGANGEGHCTLFAVCKWPHEHEWLACIESAFDALLAEGAMVAWVCDELGGSTLLEPESNFDFFDLYALKMQDSEFLVHGGLDQEIEWIADSEIAEVRSKLLLK